MPTASPAAETAPLADSFEELDDPRDGETYPLGESPGRVRYDQWSRHVWYQRWRTVAPDEQAPAATAQNTQYVVAPEEQADDAEVAIPPCP